MSRATHRLGVLLITTSSVAWSMGGLFTRMIALDSWTMLAWRGLFGALGLAVAIAVQRRHDTWSNLRNMGWLGWLYVLQSAAGMTFYLTALRHTSVANVAVIYATAPFIAAALGWLVMREKPTTSSVIASTVALLGVAVMVGFGSGGTLSGDLLALGTTWSMASTTVIARNFPSIPILPTACLASLLSALLAWPFGTPLAVSANDMFLLALFGIINFAIALPLFTIGAKLLPAIETALIGAVDAPLAPLWVWLAFREVPGISTMIGGGIVFAAVALHLLFAETRRSGPAATLVKTAPPV